MRTDQTKSFKSAPAPESKIPTMGLAGRVSEWSARHPFLVIFLVSLLAVIINCYPIIFCGKSFVSPASVGSKAPLVYDWWPPLPGMSSSTAPMPRHGRDTWAMMLWGVPAGFIESRSLLEHGELPLWNRYSHAGDTLIGQAITMLGDPLQFIVILGRGSAGAWDIKFLAAKFLFCVGFGLLILRLLGSRPLSVLYAALAAYCGAFYYINNHPVFFVFSYAPWILLSALAWLDPRSKQSIRWGLVWLLVNYACFNAGFVEVAVDLIGGLNLAAAIYALICCRTVANPARVLARLGVGTLVFLGLTAPMWLSFWGAMQGAYSAHSQVQVVQLPLKCLPGLFDDFFGILFVKTVAFNALIPETGLLVLVGCILSVWKWRKVKGEPFFWINSGLILLWGGCVFGWVPAAILTAIPLLNRVTHIYADFSYLLIIHLTIQSAYGFKSLATVDNFRRTALVFLGIALVFEGIIVLEYVSGMTHGPVPWNYFLCAAGGAVGAPLLFILLKGCKQPIPVPGWLGIVMLGFIPHYRFALYHRGNEDMLMLPGPRAVLNARSPAIDTLQKDRPGPFRVVGLGRNLSGDYSAVYGLEDIGSCAPLSSSNFINLIQNFPGMKLSETWMIKVDDPKQAQPLLNLLNVKYLLADPGARIGGGPGFRIADRSDFLVLENLQIWPRAFFSDKVVSITSTGQFIKQLSENGGQPFIALNQEEISQHPGLRQLENAKAMTVSPATNYQLLPDSTAFDIHLPSAGVVCLAEGQAKDFTAKANNEPKEVLAVNGAFKGVYLEQPGDYHIQFIYRPRHWRLACTLFWMSAGGIIAFVSVSVCRARYGPETRKAGARPAL